MEVEYPNKKHKDEEKYQLEKCVKLRGEKIWLWATILFLTQ